jgi:hypothetical protein
MAAQVLLLIGNRSGYSTLIDNALDAAAEEVTARHDWADLITTPTDVAITIAEDASYATIPTGYARIKFVQHIQGSIESSIEIRTKRWAWDDFVRQGSLSWIAYEESGKLYILPDPASGDYVRFTMVSKVAFVTGTLNITGIDRALIAFATSWVYEALEIPVTASNWIKRFEYVLRSAIVNDTRRPKLILGGDLEIPRSTMEQILEGMPDTIET